MTRAILENETKVSCAGNSQRCRDNDMLMKGMDRLLLHVKDSRIRSSLSHRNTHYRAQQLLMKSSVRDHR